MSQLVTTVERLDEVAAQIGRVFVSNKPPYSQWDAESVPMAHDALQRPGDPSILLGLYVHIPFCRKRCKFCYFRVLTDKNSEQIRTYLDLVGAEAERYSSMPAVAGRPLHFVYFGGGTPSYLSAEQLSGLAQRLQGAISWDTAAEVAFECEPGTLTRTKLEAIRSIGVTRLSLGIENFDDEVLRINGRAHVSTEIDRVRPWIRDLDFSQLNIDLIAGMLGESWESWKQTVARTIEYEPDSVTLYQLELPFNTVFSRDVMKGESEAKFAGWSLKRDWHAYAFAEFEAAGYERWSAYTVLKSDRKPRPRFVYADSVWHGSDMIGAGVSSFSHVGGVHFQNRDRWDDYLATAGDELPIARAFVTTPEERCTRELILHLKTGTADLSYFSEKFGCDVTEAYTVALGSLHDDGLAEVRDGRLVLTDEALLRVDQLLPRFYDS
ncbi:MAG: coproporphyrinogen-III oxidase family protein, partial [Acidobacteriota bacterium]|nr:coproporphyrinogen-III oxidase family protein [Acidobacteriota bacterium]